MEIIQERIEREFNIDLITTAPSVILRHVHDRRRKNLVDNPSNMPEPQKIDRVENHYVKATMMVPNDFVGSGHGTMPGKTRPVYRYAIP